MMALTDQVYQAPYMPTVVHVISTGATINHLEPPTWRLYFKRLRGVG